MKLSRPIYSLADISGAASSDMRDEIFREYHREEYLNFACQKNRPLIVNWIEDYPKILAGQSAHWRIRPRDIASDFLSGIDLALTKPKEQNEFEFRRLTGEYNSLETLRKSAFVANMFRGPAFGLKQPIVFVTSASLGEYDFANHRFALQTPMTRGAISLRNSFSDSRDVFDAVVVLLHRGRLWQEPNLPLEETSAEKLRNDKPGLIVAIEGNITYPNREFASSFGTAPEKVIFMEITKVLYIAVPEVSKPLYAITTLDLSPHH